MASCPHEGYADASEAHDFEPNAGLAARVSHSKRQPISIGRKAADHEGTQKGNAQEGEHRKQKQSTHPLQCPKFPVINTPANIQKNPQVILKHTAHMFENMLSIKVSKVKKRKRNITESQDPIIREEVAKQLRGCLNLYKCHSSTISVFGMHNCGKSTLLNALLSSSCSLLPCSAVNETSVPVEIQYSQERSPLLRVTLSDGRVKEFKSSEQIFELLKQLNDRVRCRKMEPPSRVLLEVNIPWIFSPSSWTVSILDNPGFGENNEVVEQLSISRLNSTTAYIFLTTIDSIGGRENAKFYRELMSCDRSAFTDGRIIIVVTKSDQLHEPSTQPFSQTLKSQLTTALIRKIFEATKISYDSRHFIFVSSQYYHTGLCLKSSTKGNDSSQSRLSAILLLSTIQNEDFAQKVRQQGIGREAFLRRLTNVQLGELLCKFSHVDDLRSRMKGMQKACLELWKKKVCSCFITSLEAISRELKNAERELRTARDGTRQELDKYKHLACQLEERFCEFQASIPATANTLEKELKKSFNANEAKKVLKEACKRIITECLADFTFSCRKKMEESTSNGLFGERQLNSSVEKFLKELSKTLTSKINESVWFTNQPDILAKSIGLLSRRYTLLCTKVANLATDAQECVELMQSDHDVSKARPIDLEPLKTRLRAPKASIGLWDLLRKWILHMMGKTDSMEFSYDFDSMEDIKRHVAKINALITEECDRYFQEIEQIVIEYYIRKYNEEGREYERQLKDNFEASKESRFSMLQWEIDSYYESQIIFCRDVGKDITKLRSLIQEHSPH